MSESTQAPDPGRADGEGEGEEHEHPLGTLFLLMIFLMVLAGMWGALYLTLLGR
ncbi:MAG: hypothetical protein RRA92_01395 [Gemmatimonadota bacterium]|nr:hypothetical protein [Gemmatimonadota bacterium]